MNSSQTRIPVSDHSAFSKQTLLPEEIWRYIFQFFEDSELREIKPVCYFFAQIASDKILWHSITYSRNPIRLSFRLFEKPQRLEREDLVRLNIFNSYSGQSEMVLRAHIRAGGYVNGMRSKIQYDTARMIHRLLRKKELQKRLIKRSSLDELRQRNILPYESKETLISHVEPVTQERTQSSNGGCSPKLVRRILHLRQAITKRNLEQNLSKRSSAIDLQTKGVLRGSQSAQPPSYEASLFSRLQIYMDRQLAQWALVRKLEARPSPHSLEACKILPSGPETALLTCPEIKPKIRFFEALV